MGYSLATAPNAVRPRHFQKLVERICREAGREADRVPDAADDAEGALRPDRTAGTSGWRRAATRISRRRSGATRISIVHRTLRESRQGMSNERIEELTEDLPEIARHTSERERRANDAERELVQWKKVRFMADKVGDEFDGYITGVTAFGLFIELIEHFVEGMVHVSTMADDYYRFIERQHILRGENTGRVYPARGRVNVQVIKVDMERRMIDLGLDRRSSRGSATPKRTADRAGARPSRRPSGT